MDSTPPLFTADLHSAIQRTLYNVDRREHQRAAVLSKYKSLLHDYSWNDMKMAYEQVTGDAEVSG